MALTERYKGSAKSGGIMTWYLVRWSGVVLFVLLLTHFFISHFNGENHVTYDMVMRRLSSPEWKAFDLVFLYLASYHGIMGAWNVFTDYKMCKCWRIAIFSILVALITYLVVFGTVTIVSLNAVGG